MRIALAALAVLTLVGLTSCGDDGPNRVEDALWLITEIPTVNGQLDVTDFGDMSFSSPNNGTEPRLWFDVDCGESFLGYTAGDGGGFGTFGERPGTTGFALCDNPAEVEFVVLMLAEADTWKISNDTLTLSAPSGAQIVATAAP